MTDARRNRPGARILERTRVGSQPPMPHRVGGREGAALRRPPLKPASSCLKAGLRAEGSCGLSLPLFASGASLPNPKWKHLCKSGFVKALCKAGIGTW